MIMKEIDEDSGDIIFAKGKTIGYLSQHQDLSSNHTILEELKTAKAEIIELERQIRTMELEMKHFEGKELEEYLHSYHRLTERFEQANGYAFQSELIGVLKGLGFQENEFTQVIFGYVVKQDDGKYKAFQLGNFETNFKDRNVKYFDSVVDGVEYIKSLKRD